jgi:hypothetical protein
MSGPASSTLARRTWCDRSTRASQVGQHLLARAGQIDQGLQVVGIGEWDELGTGITLTSWRARTGPGFKMRSTRQPSA